MSWISDASANKIVQSYVNNFLDLSGNLKVRNPLEGTISFDGASITQIGENLDGDSNGIYLGYSVSMNNDGTIIAAGCNNNSGYAIVLQYDGSSWNQLGEKIQWSGGAHHGNAVSLNGDGTILAVGGWYYSNGKGMVNIYEYDGSSWVKQGGGAASTPTLNGPSGSNFGYALALSNDGTRLAIGAPSYLSNRGRVYYYTYNGSTWSGTAIGTTNTNNTYLGQAIAISGDGMSVATSSGLVINNQKGYVRVYNTYGQSRGLWYGDSHYDRLGGYYSPAIGFNSDGTIIAMGAYGDDNNFSSSGSVKVYQRSDFNSGAWSQLGNTINGQAGDTLGWSVKLSDDGMTVIVGGIYGNSSKGHVKIFKYVGGSWVQEGDALTDPNGVSGDRFGSSVAINSDGTQFVIGSSDADRPGSNTGTVAMYGVPGAGSVPMVSTTILDASAGTVSLYNNTMDISSVVVDISGTMWINRGQSGRTVSNTYQCGLVIESEKTSSSEAVLYIETAGQTEAFSIRADGSLYADNSIRYSSDDRKKINEKHITNATETLNKLLPQTYTKLDKFEKNGGIPIGTESGLIAQEIYYIAPELRHLVDTEETLKIYDLSGNLVYDLSYNPFDHQSLTQGDYELQNDIDYTALGWGDKPAYVNYIGLIPYLIKATQEKQLILDQQKVTIDQQTTEVAELKTRLSSLE